MLFTNLINSAFDYLLITKKIEKKLCLCVYFDISRDDNLAFKNIENPKSKI